MEDNKQWDLYGVSHSRKVGKTQAMIRAIKATLEEGGKAGVAGCKDPQPILDRLKGFGIDAKAEPMIATQPLKANRLHLLLWLTVYIRHISDIHLTVCINNSILHHGKTV